MKLLLVAVLSHAALVAPKLVPRAASPVLPAAAAARVLAAPALAPSLGAPALMPAAAVTPAPVAAPAVASFPQLQEAAAPRPGVSPEAHLGNVFDGGAFQGAPLVAAPAEDLVSKAQRLFFPDGRKPAVASGRGTSAEALPEDPELQREMELSPLTNPEREAAVVELFKQAGAKPEEIVKQDTGRGRSNIMVVKKGRTDKVIIVGAHHDKVSEGRGAIDNWTGTTMMINLYQAVRELDTEHTYVFIGFAREEEGLIGSEVHLRSLSRDQRSKVAAMINLDTLAVDGTFSWRNNSTKALLALIKEVSKKSGHALTETDLWGGDADSSTYRRVGIPAMTLFGASQDVIFDIIHSERDTIAEFSLPHYRNAYLLTYELLKALDVANR